ncbi:uncharacterized protein DNG_10309 [Cephalotrichum gorgonifer]|uniref:Uncharacterized protein n=1 Tax=Cephalotrichum gorgonifer TaxID=2041049 RepID=A0AAE8N871_9PEZI|nr:uncharacterized protein DNG_10309 [Cephalotrichum gorgonifer]
MVLLTMTPSIVEGLEILGESASAEHAKAKITETESTETKSTEAETPDTTNAKTNVDEPSLDAPAPGKPISHGQILDLWKALKDQKRTAYTLEKLLEGARVHIPPPPPKPESAKTPEFKALMARLRREEEARAYDRMLNPPQPLPFPTSQPSFSSAAHPSSFDPFAAVHKPADPADVAADDNVAAIAKELNQQLMLVLNILLSVFGTAAAVWFAARWWSVTARLLLSLAAAIVVAIADVVIVSGFASKVARGRDKSKKEVEVREVVNTWVVGGKGEAEEGEEEVGGGVEEETGTKATGLSTEENANLRRRNRPPS